MKALGPLALAILTELSERHLTAAEILRLDCAKDVEKQRVRYAVKLLKKFGYVCHPLQKTSDLVRTYRITSAGRGLYAASTGPALIPGKTRVKMPSGRPARVKDITANNRVEIEYLDRRNDTVSLPRAMVEAI